MSIKRRLTPEEHDKNIKRLNREWKEQGLVWLKRQLDKMNEERR